MVSLSLFRLLCETLYFLFRSLFLQVTCTKMFVWHLYILSDNIEWSRAKQSRAMRSWTEQVTFWLTNDSKRFLLLFALLVAAAAADGITLNGVIRFSDTECPIFPSHSIFSWYIKIYIFYGWLDGWTDGVRITMWAGEKLTIKLQATVLSNENQDRIESHRWCCWRTHALRLHKNPPDLTEK